MNGQGYIAPLAEEMGLKTQIFWLLIQWFFQSSGRSLYLYIALRLTSQILTTTLWRVLQLRELRLWEIKWRLESKN